MRSLGLGALLMLPVLYAVDASALTVTADVQTIPGIAVGPPIKITVLRLTGMFEIGDSDKLRDVLTALGPKRDSPKDGPLATAELSSAGGDVVEGVKIGYLFHEFKVATLVRRAGSADRDRRPGRLSQYRAQFRRAHQLDERGT